jgi:DNA-binding CsgD family transcriptional regulator
MAMFENEGETRNPQGPAIDRTARFAAAAAADLRNRLARFPASKVDEALHELFATLADLIGAQDACWTGTMRIALPDIPADDPLLGWRVGAACLMSQDAAYLSDSFEKKQTHDEDPPMPSIVIAREAGSLRAQRLMGGMVDMEAYRKTPAYYPLEDFGIIDRLFVSVPVHEELESHFILDRKGERPFFSEADGEAIMEVVGSIPWFLKELSLAHGLHVCDRPLSQTHKRIVRLLLTDRSEPEIAAALQQSPKTTHKYVTEIYRNYGVRGRAGLMALWLSR